MRRYAARCLSEAQLSRRVFFQSISSTRVALFWCAPLRHICARAQPRLRFIKQLPFDVLFIYERYYFISYAIARDALLFLFFFLRFMRRYALIMLSLFSSSSSLFFFFFFLRQKMPRLIWGIAEQAALLATVPAHTLLFAMPPTIKIDDVTFR